MYKRAFPLAMLLSAGLYSQVVGACTIVADENILTYFANYTGAGTNPPFGSLSGATLPDGRVITNVIHNNYWGQWTQYVEISGFTSNPGVGYFSSFTLGNRTRTTANALGYNYFSDGRALWLWDITFSGPPMADGQTYPCSVNY